MLMKGAIFITRNNIPSVYISFWTSYVTKQKLLQMELRPFVRLRTLVSGDINDQPSLPNLTSPGRSVRHVRFPIHFVGRFDWLSGCDTDYHNKAQKYYTVLTLLAL